MRIAIWLLMLALPAAAQTVEGTVTGMPNGAAIAGAHVTLMQGGRGVYSGASDAEGRFRIRDIKPGVYIPQYTADGYFFPGGPAFAPPIEVGRGGTLRIEGRMMPTGSVAMRVVDARGDPVKGATVQITGTQTIFTSRTGDDGRFERKDVFPGNYTIAVSPPAGLKPPEPDPQTHEPRSWARTFYPGVAKAAQAAQVSVIPGGGIGELTLKLQAVTAHAVRGVVKQADGTPAPKIVVSVEQILPDRPSKDLANPATTRDDGSFEIAGLPDGEWRLVADTIVNPRLRATRWIEIAGRDLDRVELRLSAPFLVHGRVLMETRQGVPPAKPPVLALVRNVRGMTAFPDLALQGRPDAEGRFAIAGVYPDVYSIQASAAPSGYYLDAIKLGDTPARRNEEFLAEPPEVTIVYKSDGGSVHGHAEKCGAVMLAPADAALRRPGFLERAVCDPSGGFAFGTVRPGEYYAIALATIWSTLPLDDVYLAREQKITVRAGETTRADLHVIADH